MFGIDLGRRGRPLRIAYGRIFHEANAFSPVLTDREQLTSFHRLEGEALAHAASMRGSEIEGYLPMAELSGFVSAAALAGGVETVPLASTLCVPSGPLTRDAFEWVVQDLLTRLKAALPLDGVYLALHGSMDVEGLGESPEAHILRRVREAIGPTPRIAASFDLHGNLTAGIVDALDVLVAYRTNPHWDLAPTGFRAGNRLIRLLRGQFAPVHAWRKLPMVFGGGITIDFAAPMRKVFRAMKRMEKDPRVISASLFMVHPYTSAEDLGWAVHVTTDGDEALANELAERLADLAWGVKDAPLPPMLSAQEALAAVAGRGKPAIGPATLVDVDDIVGAGAPGGNTRIIEAVLASDHDLVSYIPLHEPRGVDELWGAPIGSRQRVTLRGTPGYGQPEVELDAKVAAKKETAFGRVIRLEVGKLHVAMCERAPLPVHPSFWRDLGVSVRDADLLVQKNFFHYRMFYALISFMHLPVVTAGATSLQRVRDRNYRVPTHPGGDPGTWRKWDPTLRAGAPRNDVHSMAVRA